MDDERTHEVHRCAETMDDIISADQSFGNDFLLPDMYDFLDSTPLGSVDDAFMESYERTSHMEPQNFREPLSERSNSAFVAWKVGNNVDFVQPKKGQCLLKRCIRLLKDIDSHKILRPLVQSRGTDSSGSSRCGSNYDKLAIHHVMAERRRREQMNEIFSALRALIPVSPKKGRATVLQHTRDYVIHLKGRIEELERRNRELEELLGAQRSLISFADKPAGGMI